MTDPYYRDTLARVHHLGFGGHADACAPGILARLESVRERRGLVLEIGCGSGALTRHLVAAGHRVVATDASPAMIALVRANVRGTEEVRPLTLPDDPLPEVDAIVSVGHALAYLPDEAAIEHSLAGMAAALRPGGILAFDLCDLAWGAARRDAPPGVWVRDEWVLVTRYSLPEPNRFVRQITTFVKDDVGGWRRDDERHENVLIDTGWIPSQLATHGVVARIAPSFGAETLPDGLVAILGTKQDGKPAG